MNNRYYNKNLVSIDSLESQDIQTLFAHTDFLSNSLSSEEKLNRLKGKVLATLFYEPSSRTFSSFISAAQKLGGGVIPLNSMVNTSVYKGETLKDTAKVFSSLSDVIVIRHPTVGAPDEVASVATVPVINAGDGYGEHPTQALLDSYTISKHFSSFSSLCVGMIGDLKYGRTVHSLSKALAKLGVKQFIFISPKLLSMPKEIVNELKNHGVKITVTENLDEVISNLDVIYSTRVQKERFDNQNEYERLKLAYVMTPEIMSKAKKDSVLMHPLPRTGEIEESIDSDVRALYFKEQIRNGLFVRAAILDLILNK